MSRPYAVTLNLFQGLTPQASGTKMLVRQSPEVKRVQHDGDYSL